MFMQSLTLLRRTLGVGLALAATALAPGAFAQSFTCSNPTVTPNNSFTITCNPATVTAGAAGTFSVSGPSSLQVSTSGTITISRSGGQTGAFNVAWNTAGQCTGSGTATFADGTTASATGTVTAAAAVGSGSCTVSLGQPVFVSGAQGTGATSGAAWPITITTASSPSQPSQPSQPAGCPAATFSAITLANNGASGPWTFIQLAANSVGSFSLPSVNAGHYSGVIYPGVVSLSPSGGNLVEATISKCKGEINPNAGACYMKTQTVDGSSISWVGIATPYNAATLDALGFCNAPSSTGPWYVNVRYQYQTCTGGACGYQWWWLDSWM
jgi:hypothetical protein